MKWLEQIQHYDEAFYRLISGSLHPSPKTVLARAISISGDGWMYAVVCCVAFLQDQPYASSLFNTLFVAYAVQIPVYLVLKNTLRRQRPYQRLRLNPIINASDKFSFPSGHTAGAFLFATITSVVVPGSALLVFTWAAGIGLSRVALGVHYPTDIGAGVLLGTGIGCAVMTVTGVV